MTVEYKFQLGKVTWAIWKTMITHSIGAVKEPVPRFQTRIKRLLEIDRDDGRFPDLEGYAFSESAPRKSGVQVEYTTFDAFCLSLALQLINIGLKQFDAVFLIKALREELLRSKFEGIVRKLPSGIPKRIQAPKDYKGPTIEVDRIRIIDERIIMLIPKHEIVERFSAWDASRKIPLIAVPEFFEGLEAFSRTLEKDLVFRYSNAIFIEIGITTAKLLKNLERAPEFKRGPG